MADNAINIILKAKTADACKNIKRASNEIKQLGHNFNKARNDLRNFKMHVSSLGALFKTIMPAIAAYKIQDTIMGWVKAASNFRGAILGLSAIAQHKGIEIGRAFQAASKLSADGLMDVTAASKALQNLLQRGFTLKESIEIIQRLKDAAAFNRAAHLSLAEAVVTATEGLKNENSILVDNAGVTKNVSVMWKEYAQKIGKGVKQLTLAEKRQAELNGIMQETEPMVGNAAKITKEYEGQVAKLKKEMNDFASEMGTIFLPMMTELTKKANWFLNNVLKPSIKWGIRAKAILEWQASIKSWKELQQVWVESKELFEKDPFQKAAEGATKLNEAKKELIKTTNELKQVQQNLNKLEEARQDVIKNETKNIEETIRATEQRKLTIQNTLSEIIQLEKQYAGEIKKQQEAIENIVQTTQDKIHAIRQRGMSEEERALDRQRQVQEKLAAAAEAYYSGSLEKAAKLAQEAQNIAEGLKDQEEAERGVQDAGNLLIRIHEEMKAKAQENMEAQKESAADLQKQIKDLDTQLMEYRARLQSIREELKGLSETPTVFEIDADISNAKSKIDELISKIQELKQRIKETKITGTEQHRWGGIVGLTRGGKLPGWGGGDKIPILGEAGEVILNKEASRDWTYKLLLKMNRRDVNFHDLMASPKMAAIIKSGLSNYLTNLHFNLPKISLPNLNLTNLGKPPIVQNSFTLHLGNISRQMPIRMRSLMEKLAEEIELFQARGGEI